MKLVKNKNYFPGKTEQNVKKKKKDFFFQKSFQLSKGRLKKSILKSMSMSDRAVDVGVEPRQLKTVYKTIWYDKKKIILYTVCTYVLYTITYVREERNRNIFGLFLHDTFLYNFKTS